MCYVCHAQLPATSCLGAFRPPPSECVERPSLRRPKTCTKAAILVRSLSTVQPEAPELLLHLGDQPHRAILRISYRWVRSLIATIGRGPDAHKMDSLCAVSNLVFFLAVDDASA